MCFAIMVLAYPTMSNTFPPFPLFEMGGPRGPGQESTMSKQRATPKLQRRAAELRRNQTEAEARLWAYLRAHQVNGVHFRRQHAIGNFVVDFCAPRKKLIIEVDGGQHLEQEEYDTERTRFLESLGYTVLRFWNNDIMTDIEGVIRVILVTLDGGDISSTMDHTD